MLKLASYKMASHVALDAERDGTIKTKESGWERFKRWRNAKGIKQEILAEQEEEKQNAIQNFNPELDEDEIEKFNF